MILVKNNQARLLSIPIARGRTLQLKPGVNQIEEDRHWAIALLIRLVKILLDNGDLEVLEEGTLKDLSLAKAIKLIADTFDEKLLKLWRKSEARKAVSEALDKQLQAMLEAVKKEPEAASKQG
jgi:hypothetical protein